jgi:GTP pyrophosphokinase
MLGTRMLVLLLLGVDGLQTGQWSRLRPHRRAAAPWLIASGPAAHDHDQIATDMRQIVQNVPCLQSALDAAISESELAYVGELHADFTRHTDYLTTGSDEAAATLRQGVAVAFLAHRGQRRKSGEPFVIHPMQVATILAQSNMDLPSVTAGLLHDTVEDTAITFEDVKVLFGEEVMKIVEGETKVLTLQQLLYT